MEMYFKLSELTKLEQQMYYNCIYLFLMEVNIQHPEFSAWYSGLFTDDLRLKPEYEIVICEKEYEIAGVTILKSTKEEAKICTVYVTEQYRHRTAYDAVCRKFAAYYTEDKIQSAFANIFSGKILSMPASSIKSSGYVIDTLEAVLWCIFHTTTYKDAVLTAVNLGDDTDTVGAITGGIAGIIYGLNAIPEEWISKLVNKMIVLNAASDLYKKCNKDNIIDNLDFSV